MVFGVFVEKVLDGWLSVELEMRHNEIDVSGRQRPKALSEGDQHLDVAVDQACSDVGANYL